MNTSDSSADGKRSPPAPFRDQAAAVAGEGERVMKRALTMHPGNDEGFLSLILRPAVQ